MFCDAAAPTPGRRWMQRAATAGLEELIAMPNEPQRQDYITRGLHPASAPAYGVPGDQ